MMRSLWTAGSGMIAQQFNVDVISNNLANVNTTSYKKGRAEFKDMLYETLNRAYMLEGTGRPVNLQVGHGAIPTATVKNFGTGNLESTGNPLDFAIEGDAFFMVLGPRGDVNYTRDGSFKLSVTDDGKMLTTSDGYPVLDDNEEEIIFAEEEDVTTLEVSSEGELSYRDEEGEMVSLGIWIGMVKFPNREGLEAMGANLYSRTTASGEPIPDGEMGERSVLRQKFLESSNVQIVEEMVKLIVAQRAYEINSKAIQASDEMLQQANNLRR